MNSTPPAHTRTATESLAHLMPLLSDLRRPSPRIYWADLLVTVIIGYTAATWFTYRPVLSLSQGVAFVIAGFALFRAGTFMHEIQHMPRGVMTYFQVGWNLLCGIPLLMPSYLYDNHAGHHRTGTYGTRDDAEYLPIGAGNAWNLLGYASQVFLLPALVAMRFLFLVPISLANRRFRRLMLERFSYFGINPHYRRPLPPVEPRWWKWIDAACSVRIWTPVALAAAGVIGWTYLMQLYALGVLSLGLNYLRNMAAHRYLTTTDPMSLVEQVSDSVTIEGLPLITELFFPVGLRYHALHHMVPSLPYHHLPEAHRRLVRALPAASLYRRTVHRSFLRVVTEMLWRAGQGCRQSMRLTRLPVRSYLTPRQQ